MPDDGERLPAVPTGDTIEGMVFDGEIADEETAAGTVRPVPAAPQRPVVIVLRPVVQVVQVVRVVVRHEHTRTAVRQGGYVAAGVTAALRHLRDSRTTAPHQRMFRSAEATGNHEMALKWMELAEKHKEGRHKRRMERRESLVNAARALPWILGSLIAVLLGLGILLAIARRRFGAVWVPVETVAHMAELGAFIAAVSWLWVLLAIPVITLAVLYRLGRRKDELPRWLATSADPDMDVSIDEVTVTQALANMRIPQIRDYLKQDLPLQFLVPCRLDGRGTYFEIRLPGVPAEKIVRRRADFAAGLYRLPKEVWPSMGGEAAILRGWIADKGALEEGAGPYPLLDEGFADVFKGLPFGRTLRGDPSRIPVIGRNTMCGGMPEQGKSNGARVVACGYTLDIITELRIYVPDTNFDFEHFKPRCSRYVMGAEDEFIEQISGELEELKDELQRRGQLLVDYEVQEVTRDIAHAGIGLHPVFVLLEEAHVAIQHRKYGKDVSALLCDIVKLDRKRGVHVMVSTQAPTKDSMPRDVTRNCTNGIAFAVGDHVANDALLGAGAYRGGHRATELIPGTDRGTALCKGFSGERSEMVQAHRIQASSDADQVSPIVNRALAAMAAKGRALPGSGRPLAITARDLLTDLAEVMRDDTERVRLADLPARLRNLAPSWTPYKSMTRLDLRAQLDREGVRTTNTDNVLRLDPADLRGVLARRERDE